MNWRPQLVLLLVTIPALAEDASRTIVTKDNQVYKQAVISGTYAGFATITYDDGVVHVPLSKLPDDIQIKLGCMSKADQARLEEEARKAKEQRDLERAKADLAAKAAELKRATEVERALDQVAAEKENKRKAAFEAITNATQAEANAYFKMTETTLVEKFGKPSNTIFNKDSHGDDYKILVYDERKETSTHFIIYASKGYVETGFFKGKPINSPKWQKRVDEAKSH
jgi:Skp family chaperone for outer membrane proteins